jgi:phage terminase large subunit GpA-like protein
VDITWQGQKIPNGVQLWPIGTDVAKGIIYSRLKIMERGPGCYHWPIGTSDEYFVQLTAEKLTTHYVKGYPRQEWVKTGPHNEALDCEVYCYAAALRAGMVHFDWNRLEAAVKIERHPDNVDTPPAAPQHQGRRVISRGVSHPYVGERGRW